MANTLWQDALIIREMHVGTTLRHRRTPVRMAVTDKSANTRGQGRGEKGMDPRAPLWGWQVHVVTMENIWGFLKNLEIERPRDPAKYNFLLLHFFACQFFVNF